MKIVFWGFLCHFVHFCKNSLGAELELLTHHFFLYIIYLNIQHCRTMQEKILVV